MHLRVEGALAGPPRPEHVGARIEARSNSLGVAGREDRLREDERDASAARVDEFTGEGEELDRRVGVRPTAAGARTAPRRRRCHLRQERRVADHHVEPLPGEVVRERVGVDDVRAGTAVPRRSRRGWIDVDSDEFARDTRGVDTFLDGGEEASVAARRIEHAAATGPRSTGLRTNSGVTTWSTTVDTRSSGVYQAPSRLRALVTARPGRSSTPRRR